MSKNESHIRQIDAVSVLVVFLVAAPIPLLAQVTQSEGIQKKAMTKIMPHALDMVVQTVSEGKTLNFIFFENGDEKDFQKFADTTCEQYDSFCDYMFHAKTTIRPRYESIFTQVVEETDPGKLRSLVDEFKKNTMNYIKQADDKVAAILTREQIRKIREIEMHKNNLMQVLGLPFFNFECYDVVELTASQRIQLYEIRENVFPMQVALMEKFIQVQPKPRETLDESGREERMLKEHELAEAGKILHEEIKDRIHSFLSAEQTARLDSILKEPPECFTNMLKRQDVPPPQIDPVEYDSWQKNWKPGDPIPEKYRQLEKSHRRAFP